MSDLDDDELRATRKRNGVDEEITSNKKMTEEEINKLIERTGIKIDRIYFSEE